MVTKLCGLINRYWHKEHIDLLYTSIVGLVWVQIVELWLLQGLDQTSLTLASTTFHLMGIITCMELERVHTAHMRLPVLLFNNDYICTV